MTRVYYVFDKLAIITIIIGFILGFYLAFNNRTAFLWYEAIPFIIIIAFIFTLPIIIDVFISKDKHNNKIPTRAILESFLLNIAILAVCTAFGVAIGTFYITYYVAG